MNTRSGKILKYLKDTEDFVTSETLSALCHVSTKTILRDIKMLNEDMKSSENYIEIIPSKGIHLVINNLDNFKKTCYSLNDVSFNEILYREDMILKYIIEMNDWVKVEVICDVFYISQSVLSQNLKSIRKTLSKFDLYLDQKPYYGMKVLGKEFNKRLCLAQIYISHIDQRDGFPGNGFDNEDLYKIKKISDIVDRVLIQYQISMSEVSTQNFIIHIFVSLKRIENNILLKSTDNMILDIARWHNSAAVVELATLIYKELGIEINDQEMVSLSIHLAAKSIIYDEFNNERLINDFDPQKMIDIMLDNVGLKWGLNLYQDVELKSQLLLHFIPLEVRFRYNVILRNPLIAEIKQHHILAYQLAVTACELLKDYHNNHLSEEEIGYIALHMNLALLRTQMESKKNILVLSGVGRGTAQNLAYHIKEKYDKYINEINTIEYIDLNSYDFSQTDILISSIPLNHHFPVKCIEVNYFLTMNDEKRIEDALHDTEEFHMENYLSKDYFVILHNVNTKEEAIEEFVKQTIDDKRMIDKIIENDELANNELDNMTAILSCGERYETSTKIMIGILPKPILWNEKKIQLMIMPIVGEPINVKIIYLYHELSHLVSSPLYIKRIIKRKKYEDIISIFEEIEKTNV